MLAAIGCLPPDRIPNAAAKIYKTGLYESDMELRIRLVAVGRNHNEDLAARYPDVPQLIWPDLLRFIYDRFRIYRPQKRQVDQWDAQGLRIKRLADKSGSAEEFVEEARRRMWVRSGD